MGSEPLKALPIPVLARRARARSLPCFAELVERFEGRLFNFLRRRAGSIDDAEDLTQETFVRAWQSIENYNPRWQFSTWLFTIANRAAVTHHRRLRRDRAVRWPDTREPAGSDDPGRSVADREQFRHLWDIADRCLSETQRTALWLRYAEDLSIKEIARVLGKTQITVRVTLFRAREALAERARVAQRPRASEEEPQRRKSVEATEQLAGDPSC